MNPLSELWNDLRQDAHDLLGTSSPVSRGTTSTATGPLDFIVIDVSVSMDDDDYPPSRLGGAQQAVNRFLDKNLEHRADTRVGIVSFSERAKVVSAPMPVSDSIGQLKQATAGLATDFYTNVGAGLKTAGKLIAREASADRSRILLLTDGDSNTGPDPVKTAKKLKERGICISIIGIGGSPEDINESDLRKMASVVDGELQYWFIRSVPELVQKFQVLAMREL